jgi:hypothetical protein
MKSRTQQTIKLKFPASLILISLLLTACQRNIFQPQTVAPTTLRDVPALKLNFRFEADVPAPSAGEQQQANEERVQSVQNDFDANRPQEVLDKTLLSPDKKRVLAVYHKAEDSPAQYRLDMYALDGKLLRKITPNGFAVHFPDTIVWSPDSNNVAFVGMVRLGNVNPSPSPTPTPETEATPAPEANANAETNANTDANASADANANAATPAAPTPEPPASVLTFRTEQIYLCNADGGDLKPLTQNEGMIYFYFAWAPDSSVLAALAATWQEWRFEQAQADQRGEIFTPSGRPRLVEKNGRVRLLDDRPTRVQPVWSPDSAKIAAAIDKEIRVFDAIGDAPTQASIPLRNQLLISSQKFDEDLRRKERGETVDANANTNVAQNVETLPDENSLVSFNPIIRLEWTEPGMLYLQTGFVKELKDATQSARSFLRWHRLIFSPQAVAY